MNLCPGRLARKALHLASHVVVPRGKVKIVQASISGFDLLVFANEDVGREIVYLGKYEARDSALLAKLVRPTDICFDIGANTGYYTILLAKHAYQGVVHAFEPISFNWHLLNCNIALNELNNVCANHSALGDTIGTVEFSESSDGAYSSLIAVGRRPEERRAKVSVETLANYLDRNGIERIDVLKLDVEGAEAMVIRGAARLFGDPSQSPRVALIELYDDNLRAYGSSVTDMITTMREFGYAPYCVPPGASAPVKLDTRQHATIYNVFFARDVRHFEVCEKLSAAATAATP